MLIKQIDLLDRFIEFIDEMVGQLLCSGVFSYAGVDK